MGKIWKLNTSSLYLHFSWSYKCLLAYSIVEYSDWPPSKLKHLMKWFYIFCSSEIMNKTFRKVRHFVFDWTMKEKVKNNKCNCDSSGMSLLLLYTFLKLQWYNAILWSSAHLRLSALSPFPAHFWLIGSKQFYSKIL